MAEEQVLLQQTMAAGQSQPKRLSAALLPSSVEVDDRDTPALYEFVRKLSAYIRYAEIDPDQVEHWQSFFPEYHTHIAPLIAANNGSVPAHLALMLAIFKLYKKPQYLLNQLNERHLNFQYRDVLGFSAQAPKADKAHVLFELKPNAAPLLISTQQRLSAGKDLSGVELQYAPTRDSVINQARVKSLRSVYRDTAGRGLIRFAPIANSSDGLGAELSEQSPHWNAFGASYLPTASIGFAIAAPILRMASAQRVVVLVLRFDSAANLNEARWLAGFQVYLSGAKSWLGPLSFSVSRNANEMRLRITVPENLGPVVNHDVAVHGASFPSVDPVLQVLLNPNQSQLGWDDVRDLSLLQMQLHVEVDNLAPTTLSNDLGDLNPEKAFLPFGAQPSKGTHWFIGCDEALSKTLTQIKIKMEWQGAPSNFYQHYANYSVSGISNTSFTAAVAFKDGNDTVFESTQSLFNSNGAAIVEWTLNVNQPTASVSSVEGASVFQLYHAGSPWARNLANKKLLRSPVLHGSALTPSEIPSGKISVSLNQGFYQENYRKRTIEEAYKTTGRVVLNEPYTPHIRQMRLSYKASSALIDLNHIDANRFSLEREKFFHVDCFGYRREHRLLRQQYSFVSRKLVPLLAEHVARAEFFIGCEQLQAKQDINMLLQVASGTANPERAKQAITWSVLCDNYWCPLERADGLNDGSNGLTRSGILTAVTPQGTSTDHSLMPAGYAWLRASIQDQPDAVCQLLSVDANAVEVQFQDRGNDIAHLAAPLAAKKINKLVTPVVGIKTVKQPYPSFDGASEETSTHFYQRVHERLRHKNRAISVWDIERLVLQEYPAIHRVKCLQHSAPGQWLKPGSFLLLVIPDMQAKNGLDPLSPRVDIDTLDSISQFLKARTTTDIEIHVRNPRFQRVRFECQVKFHVGYSFDFYRLQLQDAITQYLSPWAFSPEGEMHFGGRLYKSALIDMVEELPYVDYLTDVKLFSWLEGEQAMQDQSEVAPSTPDAILVSDHIHQISEAS